MRHIVSKPTDLVEELMPCEDSCRTSTYAVRRVMPDGGARSATLERMSALSLEGMVRGRVACADHFVFAPVVDTYRLAV